MKLYIPLAPVCLLLLLCACAPTGLHSASQTAFVLNTIAEITIFDAPSEASAQKSITNAFSLCTEYEKKISRTIADSDTSRINRADAFEKVEVSMETAQLIALAQAYADLTDGAFDITVGAVSTLWDFQQAESPKPPSPQEIAKAIAFVDYQKLHLEGQTVTKDVAQLQIDFGGIAKGYIADRIADYLRSEHVTSAIINLGGNIVTIGSKSDNSPFSIGIQKPFGGASDLLGTLSSKNDSIVTSGVYQRYFSFEGTKYHHILDPKTGYPADNGLISVTIHAKRSADADALSTACLLLGPEKGLALAQQAEGVEAVFVTKDNQIITTSGAAFETITPQ